MDKETVRNGMKQSTPIITSYITLGMACGVVLQDAGLSYLSILTMSLFVYSGAAQFLSASMLVMGATNLSIIMTVFFLNLRHILMSASMTKYVKEKKMGFLTLFSHTLTDESFGVNYTLFRDQEWSPNEAIVLNVVSCLSWATGTVLGGVLGNQFVINTTIMNYGLIAMFIAMMVNQFVKREYVIAAGVAIVSTVILTIIIQHNIALVIAALFASFVGYRLEVRKERAESYE